MINWPTMILAGLMIGAGSRREKKDRLSVTLPIWGFIVLLHGLGFLIRPTMNIFPSMATLLLPLWLFSGLRGADQSKGVSSLFPVIAEWAVFIYIIMGSFM